MAKVIGDAELQAKVERWRKGWVKSDVDAKKQNLDVGAEKKARRDKIVAEVKNAGVPVKAFKQRMTALDHLDKAKGVRPDVVDDGDEAIINAYDRLTMLTPDDLPLFDAATKAAIKKNAAKREEAEVEEEPETESKAKATVTSLDDRREAASA